MEQSVGAFLEQKKRAPLLGCFSFLRGYGVGFYDKNPCTGLRCRSAYGKLKKTHREAVNMASKKVGTLIKEARVNADLTQEQLARKISGLSASDISLAERGMKDLTQEQLKKIAKLTGVTQASLINAAKGSSGKKTTSSASRSSMQVTASEKKLVELYRKASTEDRKAALKALKGEDSLTDDIFEALLDNISKEKVLDTLMDGVQDILSKK